MKNFISSDSTWQLEAFEKAHILENLTVGEGELQAYLFPYYGTFEEKAPEGPILTDRFKIQGNRLEGVDTQSIPPHQEALWVYAIGLSGESSLEYVLELLGSLADIQPHLGFILSSWQFPQFEELYTDSRGEQLYQIRIQQREGFVEVRFAHYDAYRNMDACMRRPLPKGVLQAGWVTVLAENHDPVMEPLEGKGVLAEWVSPFDLHFRMNPTGTREESILHRSYSIQEAQAELEKLYVPNLNSRQGSRRFQLEAATFPETEDWYGVFNTLLGGVFPYLPQLMPLWEAFYQEKLPLGTRWEDETEELKHSLCLSRRTDAKGRDVVELIWRCHGAFISS